MSFGFLLIGVLLVDLGLSCLFFGVLSTICGNCNNGTYFLVFVMILLSCVSVR